MKGSENGSSKIERGVREYTKATVEIYFEKGYENCQHCPLMQTYSRPYCQRTGELVADTRGIGMWCPLKFEEKEAKPNRNLETD